MSISNGPSSSPPNNLLKHSIEDAVGSCIELCIEHSIEQVDEDLAAVDKAMTDACRPLEVRALQVRVLQGLGLPVDWFRRVSPLRIRP